MNCFEARDLFSAQIDDQLSLENAGALLEHLHSCQACAEEWKEWTKIFASLRSLREQELASPVGFASAVMTRINQEQATRSLRNGRRWKQAAIGTAAAILLFSGSVFLKPGPVVNIADAPSSQPTGFVQTEEVQNAPVKESTPAPSGSDTASTVNENSGTSQEQPLPANQETPRSAGTARFTSGEQRLVLTTLLKLEVDDASTAEPRAITMAQNLGASVQFLGQQSEGAQTYLVDKIVVDSTQAPGLINRLAGLGTTLSRQEQKEDFSSRYADLVDLLISLEGQRDNEPDNEKAATLDRQIEQIKSQLGSWDRRSQQQTIVLWIQQ